MQEINIYFSEDSDLVEQETMMKEWRGDIIVQARSKLYQVVFITQNRLNSEYQYSKNKNRNYIVSKTTFIVDKLDKETIIKTLCSCSIDFYLRLKSIDLSVEYQNNFQELQDLNNWTQVY